MVPPSSCYISPLPEKVLRRGSTLTMDYSSSLEFCPSFSVHAHHGSTFLPCLRLVHHESVESCVVGISSKFQGTFGGTLDGIVGVQIVS
jgi:hypothetical protein